MVALKYRKNEAPHHVFAQMHDYCPKSNLGLDFILQTKVLVYFVPVPDWYKSAWLLCLLVHK
jgi:hypothetical protein